MLPESVVVAVLVVIAFFTSVAIFTLVAVPAVTLTIGFVTDASTVSIFLPIQKHDYPLNLRSYRSFFQCWEDGIAASKGESRRCFFLDIGKMERISYIFFSTWEKWSVWSWIFFADPISVFVGQLDSKVVNPTKFYSFSPSSKSLPESLLMTILFRFSKFAHSTRTCLNILFKKLYNLWRITKLSSCFIILHVIISHEPNRRYFFPFHEKHFLKGNFALSINLQNLLEIF